MSAGDELLCVDAGPLTWQAADKLKATLAPSIAVHVESYGAHEPRIAWRGARVVVMPSQSFEEPGEINEAA